MGVAHILTYLFVAFKTGYIAKNAFVYSRYNNTCLKLLNMLYIEGLIDGFEVDTNLKRVKIKLKYINNKPLISHLELLSIPSFKNYTDAKSLKNLDKKYDYFCLFTSSGLISSKNELFQYNISKGGQLLFGLKIAT
jgi:ribosomal protein S8